MAQPPASSYSDVRSIPLSQILDKPENWSNMRLRPPSAADDEGLKNHMKEKGPQSIPPVCVRKLREEKGQPVYELVYGYRRRECAKELGWTSIEARIGEYKTTADVLAENALENINRREVSPIEIVKRIGDMAHEGVALGEIATRLKLAPNTVSQYHRIYKDEKLFKRAAQDTIEGKPVPAVRSLNAITNKEDGLERYKAIVQTQKAADDFDGTIEKKGGSDDKEVLTPDEKRRQRESKPKVRKAEIVNEALRAIKNALAGRGNFPGKDKLPKDYELTKTQRTALETAAATLSWACKLNGAAHPVPLILNVKGEYDETGKLVEPKPEPEAKASGTAKPGTANGKAATAAPATK